jgi:hypothetical protein
VLLDEICYQERITDWGRAHGRLAVDRRSNGSREILDALMSRNPRRLQKARARAYVPLENC